MSRNKEVWYKHFIVHMTDGRVTRFEAVKGSHIFDAAEGVIFFLTYRDIDGEFDFKFNDETVKISKLSQVKDIVDEFFAVEQHAL